MRPLGEAAADRINDQALGGPGLNMHPALLLRVDLN